MTVSIVSFVARSGILALENESAPSSSLYSIVET